MTGPAVESIPKTFEDETELRALFAHWLYWEQYEKPTPVGGLARALHENFLAYDKLRQRESYSWPLHARKWVGVDADLLMRTWAAWRSRNSNSNGGKHG